MEKFEKIVRFRMPFDKRTNNPLTNYGIGSMRIFFTLNGPKGAVQVIISTEFYLPKTIHEYLNSNNPYWQNLMRDSEGNYRKPFQAWDLIIHSKEPLYEGQEKTECDILEQGHCYHSSTLRRAESDKLEDLFLYDGEDAVWEYLENYYKEVFENGKKD